MKKMNNYQAPMAEVIRISIESPVLNTSDPGTNPDFSASAGGFSD